MKNNLQTVVLRVGDSDPNLSIEDVSLVPRESWWFWMGQ